MESDETCGCVQLYLLMRVLILYFHRCFFLPAQVAQTAFLSAVLGSSQDYVFSAVEGVAQQVPRARFSILCSHTLTTSCVTGTVASSTEG
jgi:hypothetical protein